MMITTEAQLEDRLSEPSDADAQAMAALSGDLMILGVDTTGDQQLRDYEFDRSQTQIALLK